MRQTVGILVVLAGSEMLHAAGVSALAVGGIALIALGMILASPFEAR